MVLSVLMFSSNAYAEEENYGKSTPSQDQVIKFFKSDDPGSATGMPEVRSRGLNIIDSGKGSVKLKHKPITPVIEEKAISMEILFDYDSATLTAKAQQQLEPVGLALAADDLKGLHFRIEGHTDVIGSDQYNIDLSRRRADAVKQFLTEKYDLSGISVEIVGKGKLNLADKANPTSEANRRVRIVRLGQ